MDNGASSYRRFLDGDESAFNEIMEELFRSLVFFINGYVHDIHAAEDIAIDAFSDLVVHRHRYNFKVTLKTYVFMLGRSRALDYIKHRKVLSFVELSEAEGVEDEKTLEEIVLADKRKRTVHSAIAKLSEDMRVVIHLIYFEEMTYDEAAKVMKKNRKQAEVFRRSEKRIKERKRNRNRILMCCIPLLICITVFSTAILPAMMPAKKGENLSDNCSDMAGNADGTNVAYVSVEVINVGTATQSSILKDDADEVAQIYYTLQSSFVNSGGDNKESVNDMEDDGLVEDNKDFSQSGTTNLSSEFRIIFTTENGSQTIYSLSGYKLINETTKQETLLTADQLSNILDTLGSTITWEEEPK